MLYSLSELKTRAHDLRTQTPSLTQSKAYEALAHELGYRDWNTLRATARPEGLYVGQRVSGHYLGHAFEGILKHCAPLDGGGYRISVHFDTPIDVFEGDGLNAYRQRVSATLGANGQTTERISNGHPQMIVNEARK